MVISVETLPDCIEENRGGELVEDIHSCKTKCLKELHSKGLIGYIFFPQEVL